VGSERAGLLAVSEDGSPDSAGTQLLERARSGLVKICSLVLPLFVLAEANYPQLAPHSDLVVFASLGLTIAFLGGRPRRRPHLAAIDLGLALVSLGLGAYLLIQSEPRFSAWWPGGRSLGERAGIETGPDILVGVLGLAVVLIATKKMVGWALPALAGLFLLYARFGALLPDWAMPHRGYDLERIVSQTFLHSQGVFGVALYVMFVYVFLFVLFGAMLDATGATDYIVGAGHRLFGRTVGGPAKVAVFSSGVLGSLSGSAVANTATVGTFTIPMMRSAGFPAHVAAGIEAAASSGGALMPPVMGAGAYMMLELVEPQVTYLQVIRAALIPAFLYYFSIFVMVHLDSLRLRARRVADAEAERSSLLLRFEGLLVLGALGGLIALLLAGFTVFRAVSVALAAILILSALHPRTRLAPRAIFKALTGSSLGGAPLIGAAACVGIVIGVVTLTGAGTRFPALLVPLAQDHLFLALVAIMISSLVLGMGLPSVVCYLLLATLIGPVLGRLGVVPLAGHFFIFYLGLMSMVTPPVALAAYAASSIAGSDFFKSSVAALRFALVGFTLPYMFVFRPELLMLDRSGEGPSGVGLTTLAVVMAVAGIVPLAAGLAGYLRGPLAVRERLLCFLSAILSLYPGRGIFFPEWRISLLNFIGIALFAVVWLIPPRAAPKAPALPDPGR
jgi:TRAP transporter 4TM/12TM fusion protein